jgi:hypothetical protein
VHLFLAHAKTVAETTLRRFLDSHQTWKTNQALLQRALARLETTEPKPLVSHCPSMHDVALQTSFLYLDEPGESGESFNKNGLMADVMIPQDNGTGTFSQSMAVHTFNAALHSAPMAGGMVAAAPSSET